MTQQAPYPGLPGYPAPAQPPQGYPGPAVQAPPPWQPPAAAPAPAYPPPAAPPAYNGQWPAPPAAAPPPAYAPQPGYAPPPAYGAPPAAAMGMPQVNMDQIAAAIAGATMGVTRYPYLNAVKGDYLLKVEMSKKPENSMALVIEFTIIETSAPLERPAQMRVSYYQDLSGGDVRKQAAQHGAALAAILHCSGFDSIEEATTAGWGPILQQHIQKCFVEPGPLVGRTVRASVVEKNLEGGKTINVVNWSAHRQ